MSWGKAVLKLTRRGVLLSPHTGMPKNQQPKITPTIHVLVSSSSRSVAPLKWGVFWIIGLLGLAIILCHHAIAQVTAAQVSSQLAKPGFEQALLFPATDSSLFAVNPVSHASAPSALERHPLRNQLSFGHHPYSETNSFRLMVVGSYSQGQEQRFERLDQDAGLALMKMLDVARLDGIWLIPISGFRDMARQTMLFRLQALRDGSVETAARAVAPSGYSEHHTGYAIDLADGLARARDLNLAFGQTDAFKWLTHHAQEFGFELSFPQDNPQGVNYEPWHWRYVGSPTATRIFAEAKATYP